MRIQHYILLIGILIYSSSVSYAQCDLKVEFDSKTSGTIKVRLGNSEQYECKLFEYKNGNKVLVESRTGSSSSLQFQQLPIDRFYRIEISFIDRNELLCSNRTSELIEFKD